MDAKKILTWKKVLIVDDEKDVLDTLVELLHMCRIDIASSFEEGRNLLEGREYDLVILDIMGVKGFDLLEVAKQRGVPALILTAHAVTEEALKTSFEKGAAYFAPKEEMSKIHLFAADVIEAKEKNKNPWVRWFDRLNRFFNIKFTGPDWREREKEFLDKMRGL